MKYLDSICTPINTPLGGMAEGLAITILDTAAIKSLYGATFKSCVINGVMVAAKTTARSIAFNLAINRGGINYAVGYNMQLSPGETWTTRPEGFLNLRDGDKLVIWTPDTTLQAVNYVDVVAAYMFDNGQD